MIKILKTDMKRTLMCPNIYLSIIAITIILFFKDSFIQLSNNGAYESLLNDLIHMDRRDWINYGSSTFVYQLIFVMPLFAGFATIPLFCDEWNTKYSRHIITRVGKKKYLVSKMLTCMICALIVAIALFLIFSGIVISQCLSIKKINFVGATQLYFRQLGKEITQTYLVSDADFIPVIMFELGKFSLMMIICALIVLVIASISKNKYLSLSILVMAFYMLSKISFLFMGKGYDKLGSYTSPTILMDAPSNHMFFVFAGGFVTIIILSVIFYFIMERRLDICE
jgi:hypothetical protein